MRCVHLDARPVAVAYTGAEDGILALAEIVGFPEPRQVVPTIVPPCFFFGERNRVVLKHPTPRMAVAEITPSGAAPMPISMSGPSSLAAQIARDVPVSKSELCACL